MVITSTHLQLLHNLLVSPGAATIHFSLVKLNLFLSLSLRLLILGIELCLPGWRFSMTMVASFLMVGGQLLMPGVAALCRNWPDRDDWQVLQIVIISPFVLMLPYVWWVPPSEEIHSRGREVCGLVVVVLLTLSQAKACTVHTALHSTEHPLLRLTNNTLFLLLFFFSPRFLLLEHILFSSIFACSLQISLSFLQDFSRVTALVAGHPALQAVQSHDAAHR